MLDAGGPGRTDAPPGQVVRLCRELIAIRSENPPGDERQAAEYVGLLLAAAGFTVSYHSRLPSRVSVVAELNHAPGPVLILQGHLDTKPADLSADRSRWSVDPFAATVRGGRLYGLGACDTKGGLAAFLTVALELADDPGWVGTLVVQGVADEEEGGRNGAGLLLERGLLAADAAVVAEPTSCLPAPRHLGVAWAEVLIRGAAAHAGEPSRGLDAVRSAYRYVAIIDSLLERGARDPEFPGHPRLNVGAIRSGGHPGTVPGECRLLCDIRVLPGQEYAAVHAIFSDAARILERELPGVAVAISLYAGGGRPAHDTSPDAAVTAAVRAAVAERGETRTCKFTGGTDASFFDRAGTPAVVYGPGSLEQAHAPDEYVPLRELDIAVSDLRRAARLLLSHPGA